MISVYAKPVHTHKNPQGRLNLQSGTIRMIVQWLGGCLVFDLVIYDSKNEQYGL